LRYSLLCVILISREIIFQTKLSASIKADKLVLLASIAIIEKGNRYYYWYILSLFLISAKV